MESLELYALMRVAARSLQGSWRKRLCLARTRRAIYSPSLREVGVSDFVATKLLLESFLIGGARNTPWLDDNTITWHYEATGDEAWARELARRKTSWGRRMAAFRVFGLWAAERLMAALLFA